jgi:hypothetical protein
MGIMATLTKQGTPTAQAFTQVRSALTGIAETFGKSAFEGKTLQETFQEVSTAAGGSVNEIKNSVGRIEGAMAILATTGDKAGMAMEDLLAISEDAYGATEKAAAKVEATTADTLARLRNNIIKEMAPLGDAINEQVGSIADAMNKAFEDGTIKEFFADFAKVVKIGAAMLLVYKANTIATTASMIGQEAILKVLIVRESVLNRLKKIATVTQVTYNAANTAGAGILNILSKAMKGLWTTMMANPLTAVVALIGAATAAYFALKEDTEELSKAEQEASEKRAEAIAMLDSYFIRLKETNHGTRERKELLKDINQQYGYNLKDLENEAEFLKEIDKAYDDIINQIGRKIFMETKNAEIQKKIRERNDAKEALKEQKEYLDKMISGEVSANEKMIEMTKGLVSVNEKMLADSETKLKDFMAEVDKDVEEFFGKPKKEGTGIIEFDLEEYKKQLDKMLEDFEDYENTKSVLSKNQIEQRFGHLDEYDNKLEKYLRSEYEKHKNNADAIIELQKIAAQEGIRLISSENTEVIEPIKMRGVKDITADQRGIIEKLNAEIRALESARIKATEKEEIESIGRRIKALQDQKDEYLKFEDDVNDIYKQLFANVDKMRNGDLRKLLTKIDKQIKKEKEGSEQAIELAKRRGEIEKQIQDNIIEGLRGTQSAFNALGGFLEALDSDAAKVVNTMGELAGGAANLAAGLASGNAFAAIAGGFQILTTLVGLIKDDTFQWEDAVKRLQKEYKELGKEIDKTLGAGRAIKQIEVLENLQKQLEKLTEEYNELRKEAEDAGTTGVIDKDRFEELRKGIKEIRAEIEELEDAIRESLLEAIGTTADEMANELVEMFAAGEQAADDFANYFQNTIRTAIINTFKQTVIMTAIQPFLDRLAEFFDPRSDGGTVLTADELAMLQAMLNNTGYVDDGVEERVTGVLPYLAQMIPELETMLAELGFDGLVESAEKAFDYIKDETGSLADEMIDMFKAGEVAVEDFADVMKNQIRNAVIEGFKQTVMMQALQPWMDALAIAMQDGTINSFENWLLTNGYNGGGWADQFGDLVFPGLGDLSGQAEEWSETINNILNGLGLGDITDSMDQDSLSGGIQQAITEETATELLGRMNMMALDGRQRTIDMSYIRTYMVTLVSNTTQIVENTNKLAQIETSLNNIEISLNGRDNL